MKRVLFLCSHNSARSQMAEGFLRAFAGDRVEVQSAGTRATRVHPLAIEVMREEGIDIGTHRSKAVDEVGEGWDLVITVCDAHCPIPPRSGTKLSWHFPDPSAATGTHEERLAAFRSVRDGIRSRVRALARRLSQRDRAPRDSGTALAPPGRAPLGGDVAHGGNVMQEKTLPEKKQPGTGTPAPEPHVHGGEGQTDVGKKGGEATPPGVKKGQPRTPGI